MVADARVVGRGGPPLRRQAISPSVVSGTALGPPPYRGNPSPRVAMTFRWISELPEKIETGTVSM